MKASSLRPSAALALAATACLPVAEPGRWQIDGVERCNYLVKVASRRPLTLDVHVSCIGRGVRGLRASSPAVAAGIGNVRSAHAPLERTGSSFRFGRGLPEASFDYHVDLEMLATRHASVDLALRSGRSLLAPVSTFLMSPLPLDVGTDVQLQVQTPRGLDFTSGLRRSGDGYIIEAHELPVATYALFGAVEHRSLSLEPGRQSSLELAFMDGAFAADADVVAGWVLRSARAVAAFYGSVPLPSALVVLVPVPRAGAVRFGNLLPESAPGIVLLLGRDAGEAELAADWVLIHELFHLGVPSFHAEGRWFDEGLATYFEPIIRVRAGLLDERALWRDFARSMPQGLAALSRGLEQARSFRDIYWGGALFCLLADVQARQTSRGKRGVEDGLRRVLSAGGHASNVWALDRTLAIADAALPAPILSTLAARHARSGRTVDLEGLFEALGVDRVDDDVRLRQDAPLAWVRRAIVNPETAAAVPTP